MAMNRSVRAVRRVIPWVVLPLLAAAGCRAQDVASPVDPPPARAIPTHRSVPQPPSARNAVLLVSLDDHLGRGTQPDRSAVPLTLITAGSQPLQLQDWSGKPLETADKLRFSWRLVALPEPLEIARRVAGPYASFESADRVASRWRDQGVEALVAHPEEWEVWVPSNAPDFSSVNLRDVRNASLMGCNRCWRPQRGPHSGRAIAGDRPRWPAVGWRCSARSFPVAGGRLRQLDAA